VTAVAIVSEGLARRLWAEGGAIGRVLEFDGRTHEVVGVVEDIRGNDGIGARGGGLDRGPGALLYLSSTQFPQNSVSLVIRSDAPLEAIQPAIRAAVRDIDRAQPISDVRRLDEWIAEAAAPPRLTTTLAGAFAIAASLLTAVGVYGVVSYTVSQRTQEIGMRMALGANRTSVLGLVVRGGLVWAGSGIVLGLFGAWSISRAIASLLFDVSPADPLTFAVTALALAGVTGLACTVPALRAACIDPIVALRAE
jgi:cell division protein FtsX